MKKVFGKRSRLMFAIGFVALFLFTSCHTAIAQEIINIEAEYTHYRIEYSDGTYGDVEYNTSSNVFDDFPSEFDHSPFYEKQLDSGIKHGAYFENEGVINTSVDVACTYDCYVTNTTALAFQQGYAVFEDVVPLLRYYVEFSEEDIMNGAQEMWYRSPIKWDNESFGKHVTGTYGDRTDYFYHWFLNIYDEDDTLVFAATAPEIYNDRLYTKMIFPFRSNKEYRFEEYVQTIDENPLTEFTMFFAEQQDLASDDNIDTYIYPGTDEARKFAGIEPSWAIIFVTGIGRVGTEKLLSGTDYYDEDNVYQIITQSVTGVSTINDVMTVNVTIPFRTTTPLNVSLNLTISDGAGSTWSSGFKAIYGVTGTIRYTFDIDGNDPTPAAGSNEYWLEMRIYNLTSGDYCTYVMYPKENTVHQTNILYDNPAGGLVGMLVDSNHFAFHFEIEESATQLSDEDSSINWAEILVGVVLITSGVLLTFFVPPVGFAFIIGTSTAISLGVVGTLFIIEGAGVWDFGLWEGLGDLLAGGLLNVLKDLWDGLTWIGRALWDVVADVINTLIDWGEQALYYGGIILNAIAEIIYFVAFLFVIMGWSLFLTIMKYVAKGDMESAWATLRKPIMKQYRRVKKVYMYPKKRSRRIQRAVQQRETRLKRKKYSMAYKRAQDRKENVE